MCVCLGVGVGFEVGVSICVSVFVWVYREHDSRTPPGSSLWSGHDALEPWDVSDLSGRECKGERTRARDRGSPRERERVGETG